MTEPVDQPPPTPNSASHLGEDSAALDAPTVIDGDVPCLRCGYNLRGLKTDGLCPECATPIRCSLRGNTLAVSDAQWVRKLNVAMALLIAHTLVTPVFWFILVGSLLGPSELSKAVIVIPIALGLMRAVGLWLLTTPEPRAFEMEGFPSVRTALRLMIIAATLVDLFMWLAIEVEMPVGASRVWNLIKVPLYCLMLIHLSRLARRLPNKALAVQCKAILWGVAATGAVAVAMIMAMVLGKVDIAPLLCLPGVGLGAFALWYLVLLARLGFAFHAAAAAARANAAVN